MPGLCVFEGKFGFEFSFGYAIAIRYNTQRQPQPLSPPQPTAATTAVVVQSSVGFGARWVALPPVQCVDATTPGHFCIGRFP